MFPEPFGFGVGRGAKASEGFLTWSDRHGFLLLNGSFVLVWLLVVVDWGVFKASLYLVGSDFRHFYHADFYATWLSLLLALGRWTSVLLRLATDCTQLPLISLVVLVLRHVVSWSLLVFKFLTLEEP